MSTLTNAQLSLYRQKINKLLRDLTRPATSCLFTDPLIKGVPGEFFRKCGKINCACYSNIDKRHGPYKVISVYVDGKQKHITLKKSDVESWPLSQHYQKQMSYLKEVRKICEEIEGVIEEVITLRLKDFPNG